MCADTSQRVSELVATTILQVQSVGLLITSGCSKNVTAEELAALQVIDTQFTIRVHIAYVALNLRTATQELAALHLLTAYYTVNILYVRQ
jgi:hypothetical protein